MSAREVALRPLMPHPWAAAAVAGLGLVALAFRPVWPLAWAVPLAVGVGAVLIPLPAGERMGPTTWTAVVMAGMTAVAIVAVAAPAAPVAPTPLAVAGTLVAAWGEEALFRRLLYARLLRLGAAVAVAGSAVAFALVHLPGYGVAALGVNLGAGILFGWQRWATGGWSAPAVTHGFANLVALGWPL
jgi:membrane protease YdiL (CAAX protease family)